MRKLKKKRSKRVKHAGGTRISCYILLLSVISLYYFSRTYSSILINNYSIRSLAYYSIGLRCRGLFQQQLKIKYNRSVRSAANRSVFNDYCSSILLYGGRSRDRTVHARLGRRWAPRVLRSRALPVVTYLNTEVRVGIPHTDTAVGVWRCRGSRESWAAGGYAISYKSSRQKTM